MTGRKKKEVEPIRPDTPVYPIGVAARLLEVHPRTLRIYEAGGLVRPEVNGRRRLFSDNDIAWIRCLRAMIHEQGISMPGIRRLLELIPCWEVRECRYGRQGGCQAAFPPEMAEELRRMREKTGKRDEDGGDDVAAGSG